MQNPQTMQDVEKIVMGGMKIMYNEKMRQMMNNIVNNDGPLPEGLSANVVSIINILWEKSNGTLPPGAIGPATMILVYEMAAFIRDAGKEVDPDDVREGAEMAMEMLRELFAEVGPGAKPAQPPQQGAQPQPQPQQPPAQPQPQQGLIGA